MTSIAEIIDRARTMLFVPDDRPDRFAKAPQVVIAEEGFRPSDDELRWAQAVVEASTSGAVAQVDGRMVDKPVIERARRVLAMAEE